VFPLDLPRAHRTKFHLDLKKMAESDAVVGTPAANIPSRSHKMTNNASFQRWLAFTGARCISILR
jgi:hypothetical protein